MKLLAASVVLGLLLLPFCQGGEGSSSSGGRSSSSRGRSSSSSSGGGSSSRGRRISLTRGGSSSIDSSGGSSSREGGNSSRGGGSSSTGGSSSSEGVCQEGNVQATQKGCGFYQKCIRGKWYQRSCPFPFYWSTKSNSCRNFTEVDCGSRPEMKRACDYMPPSYYKTMRRRPCSLGNPDCVGKADGVYSHLMKGCSQYYRCKGERSIEGFKRCPNSTNYALGVNTTFDPRTCKCTLPCRIMDPNFQKTRCPGCVMDGYYADIKKCGEFHYCQNGSHFATMKCPGGLWFNSARNYCDWPRNFDYRRRRQCTSGN